MILYYFPTELTPSVYHGPIKVRLNVTLTLKEATEKDLRPELWLPLRVPTAHNDPYSHNPPFEHP